MVWPMDSWALHTKLKLRRRCLSHWERPTRVARRVRVEVTANLETLTRRFAPPSPSGSETVEEETSLHAGHQNSMATVIQRWLSIPALVILQLMISTVDLPGQARDPSLSELKQMTLEDLMNLEVTSVSRQPVPFGQAPSAIQVITSDQIRRSGASTIPEALRLANNLAVAQKNSHSWAISARGFNTDLANKLLVLIDGRTVYTPLFSGVFWDRQDYLLEDIDRIEVISGPGSTLWGSNAVNGVINIITKSSTETQGIYLEAGGGTQLRDFAGLRYGGKIGSKVAYRAYGKYFDRDDSVFPNGEDAGDAWYMAQG